MSFRQESNAPYYQGDIYKLKKKVFHYVTSLNWNMQLHDDVGWTKDIWGPLE